MKYYLFLTLMPLNHLIKTIYLESSRGSSTVLVIHPLKNCIDDFLPSKNPLDCPFLVFSWSLCISFRTNGILCYVCFSNVPLTPPTDHFAFIFLPFMHKWTIEFVLGCNVRWHRRNKWKHINKVRLRTIFTFFGYEVKIFSCSRRYFFVGLKFQNLV